MYLKHKRHDTRALGILLLACNTVTITIEILLRHIVRCMHYALRKSPRIKFNSRRGVRGTHHDHVHVHDDHNCVMTSRRITSDMANTKCLNPRRAAIICNSSASEMQCAMRSRNFV